MVVTIKEASDTLQTALKVEVLTDFTVESTVMEKVIQYRADLYLGGKHSYATLNISKDVSNGHPLDESITFLFGWGGQSTAQRPAYIRVAAVTCLMPLRQAVSSYFFFHIKPAGAYDLRLRKSRPETPPRHVEPPPDDSPWPEIERSRADDLPAEAPTQSEA